MSKEAGNNEHYVNHLSDVNETNDVVATEDIYNSTGALLLPKGTAIEYRVHDFLVGHKMQQQLDALISVEGCLTDKSLENEFVDYIQKYPDLAKIHESSKFASTLNQLCIEKQIPRILLQKLTILKIQLPGIFDQTLFSTWLACLLAKQMKLTPQQVTNTFYAGLIHDLGLLHVEPTLVNKKSHYTSEEWHSIKQHMLISTAIAKLIHPFDDEVYRAIKEHHERCDGTGYPNELHDDKLCNVGQLIGLADMICHIRTRQYNLTGKSMANILPYLQINLNSFKFESYQAMYAILQRAELDIGELLDRQTFLSVPKRIILQRVRMMQLHFAFSDFVKMLPPDTHGKHRNALLDSYKKISNIITRGGFTSPETLDWLENIKDADYNEVHQELQELDDMQYELLWLFKKAFRIIPSCINEEVPDKHDITSQLKEKMTILDQNLLQAWTDYQ
ncbi:HD-GYP domain-containing protein [Thalassotalea sediminis]|uniref:HD-GYP domain-containing protein n=1 Tax=Thalassotalea sediminis TaxID=1759089 RepID=UPI002573793C|nr:HD domain-containing phosphohydrolase [Thalassotalea sediminis]